MKKYLLFALAGVMLGIGAASAGSVVGPSQLCRSICEGQFQACRAAASNLSEVADCRDARYECYAQCSS